MYGVPDVRDKDKLLVELVRVLNCNSLSLFDGDYFSMIIKSNKVNRNIICPSGLIFLIQL